MIGDDFRGTGFSIPQLRMLVNVSTPRDDLAVDLFLATIDLCRQRTLRIDGAGEAGEKNQERDGADDLSHEKKHMPNTRLARAGLEAIE